MPRKPFAITTAVFSGLIAFLSVLAGVNWNASLSSINYYQLNFAPMIMVITSITGIICLVCIYVSLVFETNIFG
jgi:hypothetical protein